MYANGQGVARDYVKSYMWLILAEKQGSKDAKKNSLIISEKMTLQQLRQAQRFARSCLARNYKGC
jgi:TPR repeat protein